MDHTLTESDSKTVDAICFAIRSRMPFSAIARATRSNLARWGSVRAGHNSSNSDAPWGTLDANGGTGGGTESEICGFPWESLGVFDPRRGYWAMGFRLGYL